jgi:hypothetical protein
MVFRGLRHLGQSLVAGAKGLRLASLGGLSPGSLSAGTISATGSAPLKSFQISGEELPAEKCYACGAEMVDIQTCKYLCKSCGALLDCEDVSGLPR